MTSAAEHIGLGPAGLCFADCTPLTVRLHDDHRAIDPGALSSQGALRAPVAGDDDRTRDLMDNALSELAD